MHPHAHRPLAAALAIALSTLAATPLAHAADVISSASLSIDNLRYRLVDLNPDDGIAPAVAFNGVWVGQFHETGQPVGDPGGYTIAPWADIPFSVDNITAFSDLPPNQITPTDGSVSFGLSGNSISMSATLNTDAFLSGSSSNTLPPHTYLTTDASGRPVERTSTTTYSSGTTVGTRSGYVELQDPASSTPSVRGGRIGQFTLTPQTLLIIEAQGTSTLSVDRTTLMEAVSALPAASNTPYSSEREIWGSVNTNLALEISRVSGSVYESETGAGFSETDASIMDWYSVLNYTHEAFAMGRDPDTQENLFDPSVTLTQTENQSLRLQWANLSDTELSGGLGVTASVYAAQNVRYFDTVTNFSDALPPPGSVVPEPSTYALMGLGLVGIAVVRRRTLRTKNA